MHKNNSHVHLDISAHTHDWQHCIHYDLKQPEYKNYEWEKTLNFVKMKTSFFRMSQQVHINLNIYVTSGLLQGLSNNV